MADLLRAGTVVETSFGVGVVIEQRKPEDGGMVGVRLWRVPGHSIGTAATAWLQPTAVSEVQDERFLSKGWRFGLTESLLSLCRSSNASQ